MFTEIIEDNEFKFVYPESAKIRVFPSGRRGSTASKDPFDPESRLNTEFNNRRISGIGGFSDSFIKGFDTDTKLFTFCLGGYSFSFDLAEQTQSEQNQNVDVFGDFIDTLSSKFNEYTEVYANIRLEETLLYSNSGTSAKTWILRNQTDTLAPSTILDINLAEDEQQQKYYFTGITFSNQPLQPNQDATPQNKQKIVSLCILEKSNEGNWALCQRSLLPNITHGDTPDSVQMGTIYANTIKQNIGPDGYASTPTLKLVDNQLVFSNVDIEQNTN